jgi:hypothetical protein
MRYRCRHAAFTGKTDHGRKHGNQIRQRIAMACERGG